MAQVTFTYNPTPAPACYPTDVNGLAQLLTTGGMLAGSIPDNAGGGVYVNQAPPPSANTNKVWFRIDAAGRPTGIFMFYNGRWRKIYTGAVIGEIRQYIGTTSAFDGTGLGIVGGEADGWAICNGNNGTQNLMGQNLKGGWPGFMLGAQYGDAWYSDMETPGTWVQRGGTFGGIGSGHQIQLSNLPPLIYELWGQPGHGGTGAGYGPGAPSDTPYNFWYISGTQNSPNTPMAWEAYVVVAFIMFIGYA